MSTPTTCDLADLGNFAQGPPWAMFDALRRDEPVHWNPEADGSGFWSITRHADIVAIGRDPATFTSELFTNLEEIDDPLRRELRRSMLETDGPRHRALRKLLQRDFSPRQVNRRFEQFLRGLTRQTLDAALVKGEFDFVREVSADFPIRVLARMLDVPDEDTPKLIDWGNRIIGNTDPDYTDVLLNSPESLKYQDLPFRSPASLEVFAYGDALAAGRRGGSGDDLVSKLVNQLPEDGLPLSPEHFHNYFLLLVVAGNETTRHAISHTMHALIDHPDQLDLLRTQPALIAGAVEEFLRWSTPVYHFRRTATRDVTLHGRTIREGDKVVLWYASGNRDEEVFAQPYSFDVTRPVVDQMAFGGGVHYCLGASLARLELRVMFEELIPRLAAIELTGDVTRVRSNFVNGIKRLPVRVSGQRG